tara:strand:- start:929 stop:1744 length:816 start_codon:yes stop_codon:yes gene_type:complete
MNSISIQSNISLILVIIIVILMGVYFYLDIRKIKIQIDTLEKNSKNIIDEINNIRGGVDILFNKLSNNNLNINKENNLNINEENNIDKNKADIIKEINNNLSDYSTNVTSKNDIPLEEPIHESNGNNIFGDSNINDNDNNIISDIIEETNDNETLDMEGEVSEEVNDIDVDNDNDNDNDNDKDKIDEILDELSDEEDNSDEILDLNDSDEDLDKIVDLDDTISINQINTDNGYEKYFNMSVKELKEKCIEMGLKHSGNKNTLAQRIVENLK